VPDLIHIPVLKNTVMAVLEPKPGETVLDVTLGLAGHAEAFLEKTSPDGLLIGLDADEANLAIAHKRLEPYKDRIDLRHVNFREIGDLNLPPCDIVFGDLGLSSAHLDDPERGFSFRFEGPLDLRFDRTKGKTAADLIKDSDEEDLKEIFRTYGELYKDATHLSRILTGKDVPTTTALKAIIEQAFTYRTKQILPQVFQALRIAVNDELHALEEFLRAGIDLLKPGGRMGVLSYHSLEDRMVKQKFKALCEPQKDPITGKIAIPATFELLTKKAIQASDEEIKENPRSRSVKFRALRKIA
jgi:16S rRNA (cytosine1402-N4)-methyltransferase